MIQNKEGIIRTFSVGVLGSIVWIKKLQSYHQTEVSRARCVDYLLHPQPRSGALLLFPSYVPTLICCIAGLFKDGSTFYLTFSNLISAVSSSKSSSSETPWNCLDFQLLLSFLPNNFQLLLCSFLFATIDHTVLILIVSGRKMGESFSAEQLKLDILFNIDVFLWTCAMNLIGCLDYSCLAK